MAKILVVDDDKDTCWLLSNVLKEDGYQVEIAQTGKSALKRIKAIEPDVMVLDYNLSGVSSIPIFRTPYLQETQVTPSAPVEPVYPPSL